MLEAIRNNRRVVQIVLAIIILPFALWGVLGDMNRAPAGSDPLGKIGGETITVDAFTNRVRELAAQSEDPAAADTVAFRNRVLEGMLNERAVARAATGAGFLVTDALVRDAYMQRPEFQDNGKFSAERAKAVLQQNGRTPAFYERLVREEQTRYLLLAPVFEGAGYAKTSLARLATLSEEQRSFSELKIDAQGKLAQVKLDDAAVQAFYDANKASFETPERAKIEYVVLNAEALASKSAVADADLLKWYEEHKADYTGSEERRASHILVELPEGAKSEAKAAARKRIEEIQAKLKANPASFAKLAKESSDDKANAEQGGDLGFFGREMMDPAFEKAAFALKPRELSEVVETRFGFHLIQLTDVRGGKARPFESVREDIRADMQRQTLAKRFAEANELLGNLVYEQVDTFKGVADKIGLTVQKSDWLEKSKVGADPVLSNAKLQSVVFSEKSIKDRHNSDVIDLGKAGFVSVRVVDYQPRQARDLASVRAQIEQRLKLTEAQKLAKVEGEALLAKINAGESVKALWGASRTLKRFESPSAEFRKALFAAVDDKKLPAYVGVMTPDGYSVLRIEKRTAPVVTKDDPRIAAMGQQFGQTYSLADTRSMQMGLRNRLGVEIRYDRMPKPSAE